MSAPVPIPQSEPIPAPEPQSEPQPENQPEFEREPSSDEDHLADKAQSSVHDDDDDDGKTVTSHAVWSCERCQKQLPSAWKYARHMRTHTGEKPFECSECQMTFSQKSDRDRHENDHRGKRVFTCHVCGRELRSSSSLSKHLTIHTGVKKFACKECPKMFSARGDLTKHQRIHTGEKPYQCEVCSRVFAESSTRNKHQQTHSNRRDFYCPVCYESFTRAGDLRRHGKRKGHDVGEACRRVEDSTIVTKTIDVPVYDINDVKNGKVSLAEGEILVEAMLSDSGEMTYVVVSEEQANDIILGGVHLDSYQLVQVGTTDSNIPGTTNAEDLNAAEVHDQKAVAVQVIANEEETNQDASVVNETAEKSQEEDVWNVDMTRLDFSVEKSDRGCEIVMHGADSVSVIQKAESEAVDDTDVEGMDVEGVDVEGMGVESMDDVETDGEDVEVVDILPDRGASEENEGLSDVEEYVFSTGTGEVTSQVAQEDQPTLQTASEDLGEFMCSKCDQILTTAEMLRLHINQHLTEDKNQEERVEIMEAEKQDTEVKKGAAKAKVFQCKQCDFQFSAMSRLKAHMRSHSNARPFGCDFCGKDYKFLGDLMRHLKTHVGGSPSHVCNVCGASLSSTSALKKHLSIHSGERNFQCSICSKSFYAKGDLDKHYRIHTGNKPYKCKFCARAFAESSTRNTHQRLHTGDKPFECSVCKKRFARSGDLNRHTRQHTGERRSKCIHCEACFTDSAALLAHTLRYLDQTTGKLSCARPERIYVNVKGRGAPVEVVCEPEKAGGFAESERAGGATESERGATGSVQAGGPTVKERAVSLHLTDTIYEVRQVRTLGPNVNIGWNRLKTSSVEQFEVCKSDL